nr:MAG TPA: hypothetical protein [Caudoviricetes sp.]
MKIFFFWRNIIFSKRHIKYLCGHFHSCKAMMCQSETF